jgi:hypothetical protein
MPGLPRNETDPMHRLILIMVCIVWACAPPGNSFEPTYGGSASDGDGTAQSYPPGMKAVDGNTKAFSNKAAADTVGGRVEAVPKGNKVAQAKSENKVLSTIDVTKDGASFPLTLTATDLLIKGDKNSIRLVLDLQLFDNGKPKQPIKDSSGQPSQTVIILIEGPGLKITLDGAARGQTAPSVTNGKFTYEFKGNPWKVKKGKNNVQLSLQIVGNAGDGLAVGAFAASFAEK